MKIKHCSICDKDVPNLWKSKPPTCANCIERKPIRASVTNDKPKVDTKVTEGKKVSQNLSIKPKHYVIPKVSSKQAKINQLYTVIRKEHLKNKPRCEVNFDFCTSVATDIHHRGSGSNKRKYFLDQTTFVSVCRHCHDTIHNLSAEKLYELGLKIRT